MNEVKQHQRYLAEFRARNKGGHGTWYYDYVACSYLNQLAFLRRRMKRGQA